MIARWCRRIRFCRTTIDGDTVLRRRRLGSTPLVCAANIALNLERVPVRFLNEREWIAQETAIYRSLGIAVAMADRDTIRLPRFAGRPLTDLLDRDAAQPIELCLRSLLRLHAAGHSHGDAHAGNVVIDVRGGEAHWIDFETRHAASLSRDGCLVDDLRAFFASTLETGGSDCLEPLLQAATVVEPPLLRQSATLLGRSAGGLFHRAQGNPPAELRAAFAEAILGASLATARLARRQDRVTVDNPPGAK